MQKILNIIHILRKYFILIFTLAFYMLSVFYFFFGGNILFGFAFSILFFLFAHYFIIEIKKTEIVNLLLLVVVTTLFLLFVLGIDNFFYILGLILFNVAVFYLFWDISEEVYNRIEISSYKVFTMGIKMYSLIISLVFAFSFLGTYRTFNLTCTEIYSTISKTSNYTMKYFGINIPNVQATKVQDIVNKINPGNIELTGGILTGGTLSTGNIEQILNENKITFSTVFSIDFWKNVLVNQILDNKKLLDKNICSIIVGEIKEKYNKPQFQFTVIFLIFLLFYPIIRLVLYILAIINFVLFKLMNLGKIYKFKKVVEDVEMIE